MRPLRIPALVLAVALFALPAGAQSALSSNNFWFSGTRLAFEHPALHDGQFAVATDDVGLGRFFSVLGATLSYQPGQRYIVITASDRRTVTFTLGDAHFFVGNVEQLASFAPYANGKVAYVPFLDLARALYVDPVTDGPTTVMQPQLAGLDVRGDGNVTVVTLRGASPLEFKRLSNTGADTLSLAFLGTGSTLEAERAISDSAVRGISIAAGGTPKNPTTVVNFAVVPGGAHVLVPTTTPNAIAIAFAPSGVDLGGTAIPASGAASVATAPLTINDSHAPPTPAPTPPPGAYRGSFRVPETAFTAAPYGDAPGPGEVSASAAPAPLDAATPTADGLAPVTVTAFDTQSVGDGYNIRLTISGPVTYEWHRLNDDRWYVDLKPATLAIPTQEEPLDDPSIVALRIKPFTGPIDRLPTVRVAITLPSPRAIDLIPAPDGMTIAIAGADDTSGVAAATGELTGGALVAAIVPLPGFHADPIATPAPVAPDDWKFAAPSGVKNPRLIVIDPGHGGSDIGANHNGLVEASVNLDIARRLRTALVARGWEVKMTRDSDIDVYEPNDSAHDELQARDDIANAAGARMLISVHGNASESSSVNGTTTYYYTSASRALADAVHARLAAGLPTADDGIIKENFYVIHHMNMPGILIETAFLSNPGDAALLKSNTFRNSVAKCIAEGVGDYASGAGKLSSTSPGTSTSSDDSDGS